MKEGKCPDCKGPVSSDLTCHTWPRALEDGTEQWMSCMPCDSATLYYCIAWQPEDFDDEWMIEGEDEGSGCGWRWTMGLNPRNPRSAQNDKRRPNWSL